MYATGVLISFYSSIMVRFLDRGFKAARIVICILLAGDYRYWQLLGTTGAVRSSKVENTIYLRNLEGTLWLWLTENLC